MITPNNNKDIIIKGYPHEGISFFPQNSITTAFVIFPAWTTYTNIHVIKTRQAKKRYKTNQYMGKEQTEELYMGKFVALLDSLYERLAPYGLVFIKIGYRYMPFNKNSYLSLVPYKIAYYLTQKWVLLDVLVWHKLNTPLIAVKERFNNVYELIFVAGKKREQHIYKENLPDLISIPVIDKKVQLTEVDNYPPELIIELLKRIKFPQTSSKHLIVNVCTKNNVIHQAIKQYRQQTSFPLVSVSITTTPQIILKSEKEPKNFAIITAPSRQFNYSPFHITKNLEDIPALTRILNKSPYGETYISDTYTELIGILKGMVTQEFQQYHRPDAIYFIGVKEKKPHVFWLPVLLENTEYKIINMLIINHKKGKDKKNQKTGTWYPVYVFVKPTLRHKYRFKFEKITKPPIITISKSLQNPSSLIGLPVYYDGKPSMKKGVVLDVKETYKDGFPKIAMVLWDDMKYTAEFVVHPAKAYEYTKAFRILCPICHSTLDTYYDMLAETICPVCNTTLWTNIDTIPLIEENEEMRNIYRQVEYYQQTVGNTKILAQHTNNPRHRQENLLIFKKPSTKKPAYLSYKRLYKIPRLYISQLINFVRHQKNIKPIAFTTAFGPQRRFQVAHWLKTSLDATIPPDDAIDTIIKILGYKHPVFDLMRRRALFLTHSGITKQIHYPTDFIVIDNEYVLTQYLKKTYL